ncbi:hypothetical protein J437_LFUL012671 [Ladona fulva]|uniref:Uncharacterized protein n=1 Tax=Ladona fulva TaxID=123851 RepID=A0A8K0KF38_LADFU|nr:hypothetical protein J437_LFUL012671 [Ladona fulva]
MKNRLVADPHGQHPSSASFGGRGPSPVRGVPPLRRTGGPRGPIAYGNCLFVGLYSALLLPALLPRRAPASTRSLDSVRPQLRPLRSHCRSSALRETGVNAPCGALPLLRLGPLPRFGPSALLPARARRRQLECHHPVSHRTLPHPRAAGGVRLGRPTVPSSTLPVVSIRVCALHAAFASGAYPRLQRQSAYHRQTRMGVEGFSFRRLQNRSLGPSARPLNKVSSQVSSAPNRGGNLRGDPVSASDHHPPEESVPVEQTQGAHGGSRNRPLWQPAIRSAHSAAAGGLPVAALLPLLLHHAVAVVSGGSCAPPSAHRLFRPPRLLTPHLIYCCLNFKDLRQLLEEADVKERSEPGDPGKNTIHLWLPKAFLDTARAAEKGFHGRLRLCPSPASFCGIYLLILFRWFKCWASKAQDHEGGIGAVVETFGSGFPHRGSGSARPQEDQVFQGKKNQQRRTANAAGAQFAEVPLGRWMCQRDPLDAGSVLGQEPLLPPTGIGHVPAEPRRSSHYGDTGSVPGGGKRGSVPPAGEAPLCIHDHPAGEADERRRGEEGGGGEADGGVQDVLLLGQHSCFLSTEGGS